VPWSRDSRCENLAIGWSPTSHREPRQVTRSVRVLHAHELRPWAGLALSWAVPWAWQHYACWVITGFRPIGRIYLANFILFHFGLNSNSNFENPYLLVQSSEIYATNSVGFIIL
jgi:hypothetical protein